MTQLIQIDDEALLAIEFCEFPGGYSPHRTRGNCSFDVCAARKACLFACNYFSHVRGEKGGQLFEPEWWQVEFIATLFGWMRPDGKRRYRMAYMEIARGNGKSFLAAVIAGVLMYVDGEPGADIFSVAGTRDQAREVFGVFKANVLSHPELNEVSRAYINSIVYLDSRTGVPKASYKCISADANYQHGGNPHGIIFDELHVQPNRDLWDVMQTGTIKRRQPLTVALTTAGHDRGSICWEQHEYAENVITGAIDDPSFLPVIYAASESDDWTKPETWAKANPNLGVSIKESDLDEYCKKAQSSPGYTNTFKRLHLNIWTALENLAIPMSDWDECTPLDGESAIQWRERQLIELEGEQCYAGLDLSSNLDVTALALWFPEKRVVLPWFWVPARAVSIRASEPGNRGRYERWAGEGFMSICPGACIDQDMVRKQLDEIRDRFNIMSLAYDRWNAEQLRVMLTQDGWHVVEFGQTIANFTGPTKELIASVIERNVDHGHNPVLRWMASNLSVYTDANENCRPDKKRSADKIDGMIAWLMAWGEALSLGGGEEWYYSRSDSAVEVV